MSESGDYSPAPYWSGHDFEETKRAYTKKVDRSYAEVRERSSKSSSSKSSRLDVKIPKKLTCKTEAALIVVIDVTGSMGEWPATIFSKLPYLEHELKVYLGDDSSVSFCAMGDAYCDDYPLQPKKFYKGKGMATALNEIIHEGGGGVGLEESYDLPALYYLKNAEFPNAIRKPIMVFIGDEGLYSFVKPAHAEEFAKYKFEKDERMGPPKLFSELNKKFSVYHVRKPYSNSRSNQNSEHDEKITRQWSKLIGADRIITLPEPERVVDVLFGILGNETGQFDYFEKELKERQGKDKNGDHKINVVLNSLHSIHHSLDEDLKDEKSIPLRGDDTSDSVSRSMTLDFH